MVLWPLTVDSNGSYSGWCYPLWMRLEYKMLWVFEQSRKALGETHNTTNVTNEEGARSLTIISVFAHMTQSLFLHGGCHGWKPLHAGFIGGENWFWGKKVDLLSRFSAKLCLVLKLQNSVTYSRWNCSFLGKLWCIFPLIISNHNAKAVNR